MTDRVFVTGMGIISSLGNGVNATLRALMAGESGIEPVKFLDTEHRKLPVGEVKFTNEEMAQMLGAKYPENELRTVLMGILAAKEAVASAKLTETDISKSAFINGTTVGGMDKTERHFKGAFEAGEIENPEIFELKYNDCGVSSELIADAVGKFKMVSTSSTACSSAANAMILGANLIKAGVVDIVVAGGAEALTKFHLNGFNSLMILDPEPCRPFDEGRTGINLGEGAAYLVLESEASAKRRGVKVLAELSGYANTCDAFHQTASSDNGEGAYLAMTKAMKMAGVDAAEIDYINAHGTGTPNNDQTELAAMKRIWGTKIPEFSSTKSFTGHTTSASGSIETVICILALSNNFLPQNLGWKNPMEEGAMPVAESKEREVNNIINNSFGFGGNDSSLVFSKYKENE